MTTDKDTLVRQHQDLDRELLEKMERGAQVTREDWDRLEALHQAIRASA